MAFRWLSYFGGRRDRQAKRLPRTASSRRSPTFQTLESRALLAGVPYGAAPDDTAEYMLGDVAVTVVLMESDPSLAPFDTSTEDWTPALIAETKAKIETGLDWWQDTLAAVSPAMAATLNFKIDYQFADSPVSTGYEPITRISNRFDAWIYDFLNQVDFDANKSAADGFSKDIRAFNHSQRLAHQTDWAFTIFVVNSANDQDEAFASGGSFNRAFAYAGGRFLVVPSGRPASTYAHEIGHIFWARDEYCGSSSQLDRRGYYNTANLNACDGGPVGFVQQPSIMSNGEQTNDPLPVAFRDHVSPASTLAMIGWQDSDGDGIFDVLDVPHSLSGSGYVDAQTGAYRFRGVSQIGTLPNRNSAGLQNDITINQISRAEYRIDGAAWTTAATYGAHEAALDLSIPLPVGAQTIEIRTIDDRTGVTSAVFQGRVDRPTAVTTPGVNGFVWRDRDADGEWDLADKGVAGWTVQIVDAAEVPLTLRQTIEPDDLPDGPIVAPLPGVSLSTEGLSGLGAVGVVASSYAATGGDVFQKAAGGIAASDAWGVYDKFKINFQTPVSEISLTVVGRDDGAVGRLEVYGDGGQLLERITSSPLSGGGSQTLTVRRETAEIAYAIATSRTDLADVSFDALVIGPATSTVTDARGAYAFPALPAGTYTVKTTPPLWWHVDQAAASRTVVLTAGQAAVDVDFAQQGYQTTWRNPADPNDVDNDGYVSPIDALIIINRLNADGSGELADPGPSGPTAYWDVTGDDYLAPDDALRVINHLNAAASGAGESAGSAAVASIGPDGETRSPELEATSSADHDAADHDAADHLVVLEGRTAWQRTAPSPVPSAAHWRLADFLSSRRRLGGTDFPWLSHSLDDLADDLAHDVAEAWQEAPHTHDD